MKRDEFCKSVFLKQIRNLGDCNEICRSIVWKGFAEYMFEMKIVQTGNCESISKIRVRNVIEALRNQTESAGSSSFYTYSVIVLNGVGETVYQRMIETEFAGKAKEELCVVFKSSYNISIMYMDKSKCE